MIKNIKILFFLIIFTSPVLSNDYPFDSLNNAIGLKASNISGYGFYYNRKISSNIRLQFMGLTYYYFKDSEEENRTIFDYDFGLEIQQDIYRTSFFRIFILGGAYYFYNHDNNEKKFSDKEVTTNSYNAGIGLSSEFLYKRFLLSFDLGYKFFEDRFVIKENNGIPYPELKRVTKVGAGIGVGFLF
jgi:hypothetical protein